MRDVVKTSVSRSRSSKRRRRRERRHTEYIFLVIVLVLGIFAALSMTLFFNVTDIVVNNETDTPDEEIVRLSGIQYQENLVRLESGIAAQRILASVVYAEKVSIKKHFPSTVEINVEKAVPVANVSQSYGYLLVSASNRVLEELKDGPREGLIVITGYNPAQGTIGMELRSEDENRDNVLKTLTAAVAECNDSRIVSLDMTDQSDILVQFGEYITFHMGSSNDAVYKLRLAAKSMDMLNPGKKYTLTMVGNNQISAIPEDSIARAASTERTTDTTTETTQTTAVTTQTESSVSATTTT